MDAVWIQNWMKGLGIDSYVGSSGRIFPVEMKAALISRLVKTFSRTAG